MIDFQLGFVQSHSGGKSLEKSLNPTYIEFNSLSENNNPDATGGEGAILDNDGFMRLREN